MIDLFCFFFRVLASVRRRIGLWHNVPPLDAGPKRRPVLRGLATRGCYATALSFLSSLFKSKRRELTDVAPWVRMYKEVRTTPRKQPYLSTDSSGIVLRTAQ